jgi:hypothetical protein
MINISEPGSNIHPMTKFHQDLLNFVLKLQQEGHDNILMGDFNEVYGSDPDGLLHIANTCSLIDIMHRRLGSSKFATLAGGRGRIDYFLMSQKPAATVAKCEYESPSFRFKGYHRGFFVDFADRSYNMNFKVVEIQIQALE